MILITSTSTRRLYILTLIKISKRANIKSGNWSKRKKDEYSGRAEYGLEKDKVNSRTLTLISS